MPRSQQQQQYRLERGAPPDEPSSADPIQPLASVGGFTVTQQNDPDALLGALDTMAGITNARLTIEGNGEATGVFSGDPFGLGSGIVISTGKVEDLVGANTDSGGSTPDISIPLTFVKIGRAGATDIFRADLSGLGIDINSLTLRDSNSHVGGGSASDSGFDVDSVMLSRTFLAAVDSPDDLNVDLPKLDVFDFSAASTVFHPGTQRSPVNPAHPDLSGSIEFGDVGLVLDASHLGRVDADGVTDLGNLTLGDGGSLAFDLTSTVSTDGPLYLYVGEDGASGEALEGLVSVSSSFVEPDGDLSSDLGTAGIEGDTTKVTYAFTPDAGLNLVEFQFLIFSEELPEFGGGALEDALHIKMNGVEVGALSDGASATLSNLALSPFGPYHPDLILNPPGTGPAADATRADAYTKVITVRAPVTAGVENILEVEVADRRDGFLDSGILLKGGSLRAIVDPTILCQWRWCRRQRRPPRRGWKCGRLPCRAAGGRAANRRCHRDADTKRQYRARRQWPGNASSGDVHARRSGRNRRAGSRRRRSWRGSEARSRRRSSDQRRSALRRPAASAPGLRDREVGQFGAGDRSRRAGGTGFATTFTENGASIGIVDTDLVLTDVDNANLQSATAVLTNAQAGDVLTVGDLSGLGITSRIDTSVAGRITALLSGTASLANYTNALKRVFFNNTSEFPSTVGRIIEISVSDGEGESNLEVSSLAVISLNDAPVNALPGTRDVEANHSLAIAGLGVADVDAGVGTITTTLSIAHGTLAVAPAGGAGVAGSGTGTVTLTGTVAQINATLNAAANVIYAPTHDFFGTDTLTMTTNDGGNTGNVGPLLDTDALTINVNTLITGTAGLDSFTALTTHSRVDALGGDDTITFNFRLVDATVTYQGNRVIIDSGANHTVLTGIETFVFTDGTVNNDDGNDLVDDLFYYSRYHDVWNAHVDADAHYNATAGTRAAIRTRSSRPRSISPPIRT